MGIGRALGTGLLAGGALASLITTAKTISAAPDALGLDLPAYIEAARRLMTTGTPYSDALRAGPIGHFSENIAIAYLYPPPLAQLFVPVQMLPFALIVTVWVLPQLFAFAVIVDRLSRAARATRQARLVLALLVVGFQPTIMALYIGNVSGWIAIALGVVLLGSAMPAGFAAVAAAWIKVTPGVLAIGAFLDQRTRRPTFFLGLGTVMVSFVLAPAAWIDFLQLLPVISATPAAPALINVAPAHVFGGPAFGMLLQFVLPAAFLAIAVMAGFRGRTVGWAAAATGAYLTATATTWVHYLIVLVPIGVAAWASAGPRLRAAIMLTAIWYGPLWIFGELSLHQVGGVTLWAGTLAWVAIESIRPVRWKAVPVVDPRPANL